MPSNTLQRVGVNDADYTATSSNYLIGFTSISAGRTGTLPAAGTMTNKTIIVKDESGSAGTYNITVDCSGSETIDVASTKLINTNFGSMYHQVVDFRAKPCVIIFCNISQSINVACIESKSNFRKKECQSGCK